MGTKKSENDGPEMYAFSARDEWSDKEKLEKEKLSLTEALNSSAEALNSTLEIDELMDKILSSLENLGLGVTHRNP